MSTENPTAPQQPLVSILTPVYNGETYLPQCIESVLGQTYQQWEYIIVNNCSTDQTPEIINEYALRDSRIRIVNNREFVGANRNHNIALTHISPDSKYSKFVQADDFLFPTCLEEMVSVAEAHPSVGIVTSYQLRGRWVRNDGLPYPSNVVPGREICRQFFLERKIRYGNMSAFLLRSDLVRARNPQFFNERFLFADAEIYFVILQGHDYGFVHQVLTFHRMPENALSSFPERHNQWTITALYLTLTYGHAYLNPEEYKRCLKDALDRYYYYQGRELLRLRERSFWHYHRTMMKEIGLSFSRLRLLQGAMREAVDVVFRPLDAIRREVGNIRKSDARVRRGVEG